MLLAERFSDVILEEKFTFPFQSTRKKSRKKKMSLYGKVFPFAGDFVAMIISYENKRMSDTSFFNNIARSKIR